MQIHNLIQGSPEWHAYRKDHFNASDAPAMMGCSPYKSRTALLTEKATGLTVEVNEATQKLFDDGHKFEAMARPLAEEIVGEELYPVTGSEGIYSASFDGLSMLESVAFEHKTLNDSIREVLSQPNATANDLPLHYQVQMEQQCLVAGCEKVLFMASKWNGTELVEELHTWYTPNLELRQRIVSGWEQFQADLVDYVPQVEVKKEGVSPDSLPALRVQVTGEVASTNLPQFKDVAMSVIGSIKTDLQTDQDFADAEVSVKWCKDVEKRLDTAKEAALAQTASIDDLFRTIDDIKEITRAKRLVLEKAVKTQKDQIKYNLILDAKKVLSGYCEQFAELKEFPFDGPDFAEAIKGKKTLASMKDAISVELANAKVDASSHANDKRNKLNWLKEQNFGFGVENSLLYKNFDDFVAACLMRAAEYDKRINELAEQKAEKSRVLVEMESKLKEIAKQKADEFAEPINASKEAGKSDPEPDKAPEVRPSDAAIIDLIANHYRVSRTTAARWISEMELSTERA